MHEFKRRDFGEAGLDFHFLDIQQQHKRPENVDEFDGDEQCQERNLRSDLFGSEC
ncbi:hypothetical protein D3C87_2182880 [compost metagenome]